MKAVKAVRAAALAAAGAALFLGTPAVHAADRSPASEPVDAVTATNATASGGTGGAGGDAGRKAGHSTSDNDGVLGGAQVLDNAVLNGPVSPCGAAVLVAEAGCASDARAGNRTGGAGGDGGSAAVSVKPRRNSAQPKAASTGPTGATVTPAAPRPAAPHAAPVTPAAPAPAAPATPAVSAAPVPAAPVPSAPVPSGPLSLAALIDKNNRDIQSTLARANANGGLTPAENALLELSNRNALTSQLMGRIFETERRTRNTQTGNGDINNNGIPDYSDPYLPPPGAVN